jgi:TPR repeat protein
MKRLAYVACAVFLVAGTMSKAQDFDAGVAAAQAGNFATAIREWKPLAEQGDPTAQFNLWLMYKQGLGVPQD